MSFAVIVLVELLRQVYKQAFTKVTSLRAIKEVQRFQVNVCIDSVPKVRTS